MKKTKNFIAVLLVAMGTSSVAFAGGDSLKASSAVKVISYNKNDSYKLIYKSEGKQNVTVNVLDEKGVSVHKGSVRVADGFAQNFDLSNVPSGYYTFEVVSKGEKVAQTVHHVSEVDKLTLLFTEDVKSADFFTRVYDLSQIKGAGVRFTVSYNNTVVKDQKFDF